MTERVAPVSKGPRTYYNAPREEDKVSKEYTIASIGDAEKFEDIIDASTREQTRLNTDEVGKGYCVIGCSGQGMSRASTLKALVSGMGSELKIEIGSDISKPDERVHLFYESDVKNMIALQDVSERLSTSVSYIENSIQVQGSADVHKVLSDKMKAYCNKAVDSRSPLTEEYFKVRNSGVVLGEDHFRNSFDARKRNINRADRRSK